MAVHGTAKGVTMSGKALQGSQSRQRIVCDFNLPHRSWPVPLVFQLFVCHAATTVIVAFTAVLAAVPSCMSCLDHFLSPRTEVLTLDQQAWVVVLLAVLLA